MIQFANIYHCVLSAKPCVPCRSQWSPMGGYSLHISQFLVLKLHIYNKMASVLLLMLLSCLFVHLVKQHIYSFGQQTPFGDVQSTVEAHDIYKYIYLCFQTKFYPGAILHWGHVFKSKIFKKSWSFYC